DGLPVTRSCTRRCMVARSSGRDLWPTDNHHRPGNARRAGRIRGVESLRSHEERRDREFHAREAAFPPSTAALPPSEYPLFHYSERAVCASLLLRIRNFPIGKSSSCSRPTRIRTSFRTGWPIASHIRRTWRFLPSVMVNSNQVYLSVERTSWTIQGPLLSPRPMSRPPASWKYSSRVRTPDTFT